MGAAAAVAAGVQGFAVPGARAAEDSVRARDGVGDGSTFQAWKGVAGDEQVWWGSLVGYTWKAPQPVGGARSSFRPALATIGS
ncbi:hypothetical protein CP982_00075 [Streptomyces spectabilis]|uniref:Uncharacterized protein n=1 Tax=Streptomyces spectabilis TaxID=68270 RepID=A0A5P2X2D7_STRST|nr:hypothetical protein CP982_00075 [Streptomyces spectabilis]